MVTYWISHIISYPFTCLLHIILYPFKCLSPISSTIYATKYTEIYLHEVYFINNIHIPSKWSQVKKKGKSLSLAGAVIFNFSIVRLGKGIREEYNECNNYEDSKKQGCYQLPDPDPVLKNGVGSGPGFQKLVGFGSVYSIFGTVGSDSGFISSKVGSVSGFISSKVGSASLIIYSYAVQLVNIFYELDRDKNNVFNFPLVVRNYLKLIFHTTFIRHCVSHGY